MTTQEEQLAAIAEMRSLMAQSSRFISLSGLSGVWAGSVALAGYAAASWKLGRFASHDNANRASLLTPEQLEFLILDASAVLALALAGSVYFTTRKASASGVPVWSGAVKQLLMHLFVPLALGGGFCLVLLWHGAVAFVAPATLIFYGLALQSASKYSLPELWYLGVTECVLGLLAAIWVGHGLALWGLGFGVMHILYGGVMYWRYDRALPNDVLDEPPLDASPPEIATVRRRP